MKVIKWKRNHGILADPVTKKLRVADGVDMRVKKNGSSEVRNKFREALDP